MAILDEIGITQWVILGAFLTTLLPIAAGWRRYKTLSPALRSILWFCCIGFVLDGISRALWLMKTQNLVLGHLNTIVEFLLLANAYRLAFDGFIPQRRISFTMGVFLGLALANTLFLQSVEQNNTYIKIVEALVLIGFSLAYFYKLAKEMKVLHLERHPFFWVNTAVLIYFSSNLFVFIYSNYLLLYSQQLGIRIWFIHALFFILFNTILTLALWTTPKNSSSLG